MTNNELNWDYPAGFFKCCTWVAHHISNCYLLETKVFKAHSDKSMDGLIAGVDHCDYHHGGCALKQGSALVWQPNKTELCEFIPWKTIEGEGLGDSWLSTDHNIAVTRTKTFIRSCGQTLFISKQGIAYITKKRSAKRDKRQTTTNSTGMVLTPQLSAQLQALEIITRRNINFALSQSIFSVCQNLNTMMTYMSHLMLAQPTSAVRALMNRSTLIARAGYNIIEVFPCAELPVDSYSFKPMNKTCTKEIPIVFQAGKKAITGYMDVYTNEIHEVPTIEDCSLAQEMPLSVGNQTCTYIMEKLVI
ncbi:MAG: hypothetical protein GY816_16480 [Cytophagales bacterium]|nr:hypothetical protein [Cytophagales bacterium]